MEVSITLREGEIVRVVGPARVEVLEGEVLLVGAVFRKGESAVIHRLRSYALKALKNSSIKITLGDEASVERPGEDEEVIDEWLRIVKGIEADDVSPKRILILGPVESGKTTLAAFLANWFIRKGTNVCLVEADIGQEDVAVPTVVALARPTKRFVWQREVRFETIRFVGCISPLHCQHQLLGALLDTLSAAESAGCEVVVINTDGWVGSKQALDFKISIARWGRPSHIAVLDKELYEIFRKSFGTLAKVLYVPPPVRIRERGRDERRMLRSEAYRRYFSSARVRIVDIDKVSVIGSSVLSGVELGVERLRRLCGQLPEDLERCVIRASLYGQCLNLVVRSECVSRQMHVCGDVEPKLTVNVVRQEDLKGYLISILDRGLNDVGLGVIVGTDLENGVIRVLTPYTGDIAGLMFSKVKLSEDYEDTCRVLRCCP